MDRIRAIQLWLAGVLFAGLILSVSTASAQEEVASAIRRYKAYEASTGYYEEYEVLPRRGPSMCRLPPGGGFRYPHHACQSDLSPMPRR